MARVSPKPHVWLNLSPLSPSLKNRCHMETHNDPAAGLEGRAAGGLRLPVLRVSCSVTDDHEQGGLEQHGFIISWFTRIRDLCRG